MFRKLCCSVVALTFVVATVMAAEYTGPVEKINAKSGSVTIKVKDKSMSFDIPPVAKVIDKDGKALKGRKRLAGISAGTELTITTTPKKVKDVEKEIITEVKIK